MNKNIFQSLKIIALALVLSVGISYVSAWTAPTVTPPNGNVAAPINVGSTAQIKTGNLTANYLTASSEANAPVFKDTSDTNYFLNPNGDSVLANIYATKICFGADCKTAWPAGGSTYFAGNGLTLIGNTFSTNTTQTQARVSGTCAVGSSIRVVNADGTVSCQTDNVGAGGTTYSAGSGLTLSGSTFTTNTAQTQVRVGGTCAVGSSIRVVNADGTVSCQTDNTGATLGATFNFAMDNNCNNWGLCVCPGSAVQIGQYSDAISGRVLPVCRYLQ